MSGKNCPVISRPRGRPLRARRAPAGWNAACHIKILICVACKGRRDEQDPRRFTAHSQPSPTGAGAQEFFFFFFSHAATTTGTFPDTRRRTPRRGTNPRPGRAASYLSSGLEPNNAAVCVSSSEGEVEQQHVDVGAAGVGRRAARVGRRSSRTGAGSECFCSQS